jgi:NAD(P)-dependent dehydrogenase (short-subunit alcohol dehydrogenase family)
VSELADKVAVITGASRGIGRAIAGELHRRGARVTLAARDAEALRAAAAGIDPDLERALAVPADVTAEDQVEAVFAATVARFGRLDVLVNNAGAFDGGPVEDVELTAWNRVIATCLTGAFLCTRAAFRHMKPQGGGRIVNIGSISAQRPRLHSAPYTAAKHGLWGLTQATALEGRQYGIAVSCLHPGNVLVERRQGEGGPNGRAAMVVEAEEPMMDVAEIAAVAADMAAMPRHVNMLEAIVLPVRQAYLGRG